MDITMIQKIREFIKRHRMILPGDTVIAGVSGGADSVCLLFVLLELQKEITFTLAVVHVNHQIRVEAGKDAKYVQDICEAYRIPFHLEEQDVKSYAKKQRISEEEAGREIRYNAFYKILRSYTKGKGGKIAVAHTQNDLSETVLFHLFRGSGIKGLAGIPPVRDCIVRPLLCVDRESIESFLKDKNITFCIDSTNEEDTYTRNKIRHHILPYAVNTICSESIEHIGEAAELLREADDYFNQEVLRIWEKNIKVREDKSLMIRESFIGEEPPILQKYTIKQAIAYVADSQKDITQAHVRDVLELFSKQVGKQISLPYHLVAVRGYKDVTIQNDQKEDHTNQVLPVGEIVLSGDDQEYFWEAEGFEGSMGVHVKCEYLIAENVENITKKAYTKWLDCDRIKKCVTLRTRKSGDYIIINEQGHKKSIKEYMIHEKIPKEERNRILLVAEDHHIMWIVGYRISYHYRVTKQTKRILKLQVRGGYKDDGEC